MSKKDGFDLRVQFREAWDYIKETRNYIYVIVLVFFVCAILGYVFASQLTFLDELVLKSIISETEGLNVFEMILYILQNNLFTALMAVILGVFFGVFPLGSAMSNGVVVGYVYHKASGLAGPWIIWRLFPHGIFELPAVFLAMALGLKLGTVIFSRAKNRGDEFRRRLYNSANVFLMIVIPLLIVAAIIEGILIAFVG